MSFLFTTPPYAPRSRRDDILRKIRPYAIKSRPIATINRRSNFRSPDLKIGNSGNTDIPKGQRDSRRGWTDIYTSPQNQWATAGQIATSHHSQPFLQTSPLPSSKASND